MAHFNPLMQTENEWHLLHFMPDAAICMDKNGAIVATNELAQKLLGYDGQELSQLKINDLFINCSHDTKTNCSSHICFFSSILDNEMLSGSCEVEIKGKDGIIIPVLLSTTLYKDHNNENTIVCGTLHDISHLKQAERRLQQEKNRFEFLFHNMSDAVFLSPITADGMHGNFAEVNEVACKRLGYTRKELLQLNARSLNPQANVNKIKSMGRNIRREGVSNFEAIHVAKDGMQIPVHVTAKSVTINHQEYVLSVARDLREIKKLQKSEAIFGRLMDHSWDEIYLFGSEDLKFLQVNKGARDNLGYTKNEFEHFPITNIATDLPEKDFRELAKPLFDGSKSQVIIETRFLRKDSTSYPVEIRLQLSHSEVPPVFLAIAQDITERKKIEKKLKYLANYDALTGLPNRTLFMDRLQMSMAQSNRNDGLCGLLFLDLDGFKAVNDTLGHNTGDELLKIIGRRISEAVRRTDTVARLGGDEFTVIATNCKNVAGVEKVAEKLIPVIAEPMEINGQTVKVTSSIGISLFPFNESDDLYHLIKQADTAMYQAKRSGKNKYHFYSASLARSEHEVQKKEEALQQAILNNELYYQYQPKINLANRQICGAEALLRWESKQYGNVSPVEFIPLMEELEIIQEVSRWGMKQLFNQLSEWLDINPNFNLAINVSAKQFDNRNFSDELQRLLEESNIPPRNLEIEITEGVLISHTSNANTILEELRQMGISISLDDFGTGYSSLSYLKQFPIDRIKIDRSFVSDITKNNENSIICETIIKLAHKLKMQVTAEGIEDKSQLELLEHLQCNEGQGYYFSKPINSQQFTDLLYNQEVTAKIIPFKKH